MRNAEVESPDHSLAGQAVQPGQPRAFYGRRGCTRPHGGARFCPVAAAPFGLQQPFSRAAAAPSAGSRLPTQYCTHPATPVLNRWMNSALAQLAGTVLFLALTLSACGASSSVLPTGAAAGPAAVATRTSAAPVSAPAVNSAEMLSELFGCTRAPGAPEQMTTGTQIFNCVGEPAQSDNMSLYIFTTPGDAMGMRRIGQVLINASLSKGNTLHYVSGDGWAIMGTDEAVTAAAVNAGGT